MLPSGWYVLPVVSNQNSCCQKVELVELAAMKLPQDQRDHWGWSKCESLMVIIKNGTGS